MEDGHATAPRIPWRRLERVDGSPVLEIELDLDELDATMPLPSPPREAAESGAEVTVSTPPPIQEAGADTATPSSPPSRGAKRPAAGEEGPRSGAPVIELEGEYEGESGWGEVHNRLAVEELQEWLAPRDEPPRARTPTYDELHRGLHQWLFRGGKSPPLQCSTEHHAPPPIII